MNEDDNTTWQNSEIHVKRKVLAIGVIWKNKNESSKWPIGLGKTIANQTPDK